jgi:hypothetical protein
MHIGMCIGRDLHGYPTPVYMDVEWLNQWKRSQLAAFAKGKLQAVNNSLSLIHL